MKTKNIFLAILFLPVLFLVIIIFFIINFHEFRFLYDFIREECKEKKEIINPILHLEMYKRIE
jgi:hypothetical protein